MSRPSDDDKQTSGLPAPSKAAMGITAVPDAGIICEAKAGAAHDSSAHTRACVPGDRRTFTTTALSPCQASVAAGRISTNTCVLEMGNDCASAKAAHHRPRHVAFFIISNAVPIIPANFPSATRGGPIRSGVRSVLCVAGVKLPSNLGVQPLYPKGEYMSTNTQPFITDVKELRARARASIEKGPITPAYQGDVKQAIDILQSVLATEIVCVLRYTMNAIVATGLSSESVKEEFDQHAKEERGHMREVAERINQLGGKPNFNPEGLTSRAASQYTEGANLVEMIKENLVAERIACEHYRELIRYFADKDSTTRVMLEGILVNEEEHANDMHDLLVAHEGKPMLAK